MARFAAYNIVLTGKRQLCCVVIERINLLIKHPSFWTVADTAAELEILSVRMIDFLFKKYNQAAK
jgi:hypothetical protein